MNANTNGSAAEIFVLRSGDWRASVSPRGAALLDLIHDDLTVVTPEWPQAQEFFAGVSLAPWVNRLADGTWTHESRTFHAPINDKRNNCANHGTVFARNFDVIEHSDSRITLGIDLRDDTSYDFDVRFEVRYELDSKGLSVTLSTTNLGAETAPVAVGSHPYLVTEPGSLLSFEADGEYAVDSRMLPERIVAGSTHRLIEVSQPSGFTDTCFVGLQPQSDGLIRSTLTRPRHNSSVVIWQEPAFSHLQVFTLMHAEIAEGQTLLALEPQTAGANALNTGDALIWLEPNESWRASWGIEIEEMSR